MPAPAIRVKPDGLSSLVRWIAVPAGHSFYYSFTPSAADASLDG
jgi:hypothetical protein